MAFSKRDRFQVAAFHLEYKLLGEGEKKDSLLNKPLERFVSAIAMTSDDVVDGLLDNEPTIIDQWWQAKKDTEVTQ